MQTESPITVADDAQGVTLPADRLQCYLALCLNDVLSDGKKHGTKLHEACKHSLMPGGKFLRPLLVLESCAMVGGDTNLAMPAAISAELAHVASLVHDDIIDGDAERRGRDSTVSRFGLDTAILAGDSLIFHAFSTLAANSHSDVSPALVLRSIGVVAQVGLKMARGQSLELENAGNTAMDLDLYLEIIHGKTASLMWGSTNLGSTLGGGSDSEIRALCEYGEALGMAFQIRNDIDSFLKTWTEGRTCPSDVVKRRMTAPIIFALKGQRPESLRQLERVFKEPTWNDWSQWRSTLSGDPLRQSRSLMNTYIEEAVHALQMFPETENKARLVAYACRVGIIDHMGKDT